MRDEQFFKKKQLLIQRDQLLEEIGQGVFDEGELPPLFVNLPKEFRGMDLILNKLKERLRQFREEHDRKVAELRIIQDELIAEEKCHKKNYEPLRHECEEQSIKLEFKRNQGSDNDEAMLLEQEALQAQRCQALEALEKEHLKTWAALLDGNVAQERKIYRLEKTILEVQEEMEGLASGRAKRLRDLGYWFHHRKPGASFGPEFAQLKLLRLELTEFKQLSENHEPVEIPQELPTNQDTEKWRGPIFLLLAAVCLGFFFRTDFSEADLSFSELASSFMPESVGVRVYADLTSLSPQSLDAVMPKMEALPGGDVFRNMKNEDILEFMELRGGKDNGELLSFGVRFRRPPPRFAFRLNSAGWRYQSSVRNWKALSDGTWVWLALNERSFFLFPKSQVEAFTAFQMEGKERDLLLDLPMTAPGSNRVLLQGFDHLRLSIEGSEFELNYSTQQVLADIPLRQAWLNRAIKLQPEPIRVKLSEKKCTIKGPRSFLAQVPLNGPSLISTVSAHLNKSETSVRKPIALRDPNRDFSSGTSHRLVILDSDPFQTERNEELANIPLPGDLYDIAFHNPTSGLLVLCAQGLIRYGLSEGLLSYDCALEDGNIPPDFSPQRMVVTPDENYAVLLEKRSNELGRSRVALVSLDPFRLVSLEPLAPKAEFWQSAAWDHRGEILYLACPPGKGSKSARQAVVLYRHERDMLLLQSIADLEADLVLFQLPDLAVHPINNQLFFTTWPAERLLRRDLSSSTGTLKLDLRQHLGSKNPRPNEGAGLILSRTGNYAMVIASLDKSSGEALGKGIYLVDIGGPHLSVLDTAEPGFIPDGLWRQPLSDRVWVLASDSPTAHVLEIVEGRLHGRTLTSVGGIRPRFICSDRFGKTLFIAGPSL